MNGQMMGQNMPEAVKQAFPNAAAQSASMNQLNGPPRTLQEGLQRMSNLLDFARDIAARAGDLADNMGGPTPSAEAKGQQSGQGLGTVGALFVIGDQFEATLMRIQGELGRIRAAHG